MVAYSKSAVSNFRLSVEEKQILKATADRHFQGKISTMIRCFVFSGIQFLEETPNSDQPIQFRPKDYEQHGFLPNKSNISQTEKPLAYFLAGSIS